MWGGLGLRTTSMHSIHGNQTTPWALNCAMSWSNAHSGGKPRTCQILPVPPRASVPVGRGQGLRPSLHGCCCGEDWLWGPTLTWSQDWVTISERAVPQQKALGTEELCHLGSKGRAGVALVKGCICSHS